MVKILLKTRETHVSFNLHKNTDIIFPILIMHKYNEYKNLELTDNTYFDIFCKDTNYVIFCNNIPRYDEKLIELLEEFTECYNQYKDTYSIVDFPANIKELNNYCICNIQPIAYNIHNDSYAKYDIEYIVHKRMASHKMYQNDRVYKSPLIIDFKDFEGNTI